MPVILTYIISFNYHEKLVKYVSYLPCINEKTKVTNKWQGSRYNLSVWSQNLDCRIRPFILFMYHSENVLYVTVHFIFPYAHEVGMNKWYDADFTDWAFVELSIRASWGNLKSQWIFTQRNVYVIWKACSFQLGLPCRGRLKKYPWLKKINLLPNSWNPWMLLYWAKEIEYYLMWEKILS